jgi:hypothetical protein
VLLVMFVQSRICVCNTQNFAQSVGYYRELCMCSLSAHGDDAMYQYVCMNLIKISFSCMHLILQILMILIMFDDVIQERNMYSFFLLLLFLKKNKIKIRRKFILIHWYKTSASYVWFTTEKFSQKLLHFLEMYAHVYGKYICSSRVFILQSFENFK